MLKTALRTAVLGLALISGAASATQGLPGPLGGIVALAQEGGASAPQQLVLGTWALQTAAGVIVATYRPDASVNGLVHLRNQPRPIPFHGSWAVRPLGPNRFELTVNAGQLSGRDTLSVMPDGNLFNEQARAVVYRVR